MLKESTLARTLKGIKTMKILIAGSAANPPHLGHLSLIRQSLIQNPQAKLIWLVSGYRRDKPNLVSLEHRVVMTQMLLNRVKNELRDRLRLEIEIEGSLPTIQVLEKWQKKRPEDKIVWVGGADHFLRQEKFDGHCEVLARWVDGELLFQEHEILIASRGKIKMEDLERPPRSELLTYESPDFSSSEIRKLVKSGEDISFMVGEDIADYIKNQGLYTLKGSEK